MGAGDAVHDGQAETDSGVLVGAYAFRFALERLGEGRYEFRRKPTTRVLDPQHARVSVRLGVDRHGAPGRDVVDDGVLDEVRHHPQQELRGAAGPSRSTGHVERDPALFGEGEQRFGGFFGDEGEVDGLVGEVPAVASAQQQEGLGEVDGPCVDRTEAFDEFPVVRRGVAAGDVEECLRDGQRRSQFVAGVRGEPLLFGDMGFELFEHGVEHVGEFAELVSRAFQADPMGQRSVRGRPGSLRDPRQRREHPAGQDRHAEDHQATEQHPASAAGRRDRGRVVVHASMGAGEPLRRRMRFSICPRYTARSASAAQAKRKGNSDGLRGEFALGARCRAWARAERPSLPWCEEWWICRPSTRSRRWVE